VPLVGLFTRVAIDGSTFRAVNNRDKNFIAAKAAKGEKEDRGPEISACTA
jgi:hypothetical protein